MPEAGVGDDTDVGLNFVTSYMTVMNAFKNDSINIQTGKYQNPMRATNYFRAGPYGVEGQLWFVRMEWQNQDS